MSGKIEPQDYNSDIPVDKEEEDKSHESPAQHPLATIRLGIFNGANPLNNVSEDVIETYFSSHGESSSSGSLMYPVITDEENDEESVAQLMDLYRGLFDYWLSQLKAGFNILLYGCGSKMALLDEFHNTKLSSLCTMTIYGFFPNVTLKDILNTITSEVFEHSGRFKSISLQCEFICSSLLQQDKVSSVKELYLIIHNIDGKPLQEKKMQHMLSLLATCPSIHIIASIDHPRAPLLWDEKTMQHFNWVWHHTPTYEQYNTELSYDKTAASNGSASLVQTSAIRVLTSLTPNARGIFSVLADYQLGHNDDSSYAGLSFTQLYQKCREKFLVSSDVSLRAQLTEFKDHKIIQFKKGQDGAELVSIPLKTTVLEQLITQVCA